MLGKPARNNERYLVLIVSLAAFLASGRCRGGGRQHGSLACRIDRVSISFNQFRCGCEKQGCNRYACSRLPGWCSGDDLRHRFKSGISYGECRQFFQCNRIAGSPAPRWPVS